jgi:hypothetical protein
MFSPALRVSALGLALGCGVPPNSGQCLAVGQVMRPLVLLRGNVPP